LSTIHRPLPRPFTMPWGKGKITEEAAIARDHWEPTVQLMEYDDGGQAVRFCFYTGGRFNRSPLILGEDDVDDLRAALDGAPAIRELLRRLVC